MKSESRRISLDLVKQIEKLQEELSVKTGKDVSFPAASHLFAGKPYPSVKIETGRRKRLKIEGGFFEI